MKPLFAILLGFFAASNAFAQMPPSAPPRMVTVSGEAREELAPDQAILNASIVSRHASLPEAKKQNDERTQRLIAIAQEYKIPKDKINASHVYISPEYRYDNPSGKQIFTGYVVNRSVAITMDDIGVHERVLSALIDAKIDQVGGVQFAMKNPEDIQMRLRGKAVENARARAEALAKAAGAKVGKAINISEGGGGGMPRPPMPMMAMAKMEMAGDAASVAPSLPGLLTVSQSVNVTFELE